MKDGIKSGKQDSIRIIPLDSPEVEVEAFDPTRLVQIGRSSSCQIRIPATVRDVSRVHARIANKGGKWFIQDTSTTGTYINERRMSARATKQLSSGDTLRIGPLTFRTAIGSSEEQGAAEPHHAMTSMPIARLNTDKVLKSALELPGKLAEASDEAGVYRVACTYLVTTLKPAIESAHVLLVSSQRIENTQVQVLGSDSDPDGEGTGAPLLSRRVVERLISDPEQVIFIHRVSSDDEMDATVAKTTLALGASLIEITGDGNPIVLYITGSKTVASGKSILAEYLRLVAVLTKQHLITLRQAALSKFFSPKVIQILMQRGGEAKLRGDPWVTEATSLFFDLRGFSLSTEAHAEDLLDLHSDLQTVIDGVTHEVFERDGTVIDYQGDGIFAAWGVPFEQSDQVNLAVDCALGILSRLETMDLPVFRKSKETGGALCGIGIAQGKVVAGGVGAGRMFKFGILGPSVNLAARMESLTKPSQMDAPILVTGRVAEGLDSSMPIRRIGKIRPAEMKAAMDVFEVVVQKLPREEGWNQTHDILWNELLSRIENARSLDDLKNAAESLKSFPPKHPRKTSAESKISELAKPGALADWTGVMRQTKRY